MAGHSKFKNIMHRKGAQDKKRAKLFTKITREIIVAARSGAPDINSNPRLRTAIAAAKHANIPKDKIENAIKRANSDTEGENYDEIRYEGYGPGGIAILVEAVTDNKNRTATAVRTAFAKNGGTLSETGSVSYMFQRVGIILYVKESINSDEIFEVAIEVGAIDCQYSGEMHEISCNPENFVDITEKLEKKFGKAEHAEITWKPDTMINLDTETSEKVESLIEALEDCDDVQSISGNFIYGT